MKKAGQIVLYKFPPTDAGRKRTPFPSSYNGHCFHLLQQQTKHVMQEASFHLTAHSQSPEEAHRREKLLECLHPSMLPQTPRQ